MLSMNCIGVFIPPSMCSLFAEKLTHEENLIIVLATNKKRKIKINNRVGRGGRGCSDIPLIPDYPWFVAKFLGEEVQWVF